MYNEFLFEIEVISESPMSEAVSLVVTLGLHKVPAYIDLNLIIYN